MLLLLACVAPRIADRVEGEAACTIHVPADEPDLQEAIDHAFDGDVICVGPGTYTGLFQVDNTAIELRGDGATLQGDGEHSVLHMRPGEGRAVTVSGFTITGGVGTSGGGVYLDGDGVLEDLVVEGNAVESHYYAGGGGMAVNGDVRLSRVVMRYNTVYADYGPGYGGGLCVYGGVVELDEVVAEGNTVWGSDGGWGGGIAVLGEVYAVDVRAEGNTAPDLIGAGGGIHSRGSFIGRNVLVAGNAGGGLGATWGHVGLENATITDNTLDGLDLVDVSATFVNVDISKNLAVVDTADTLSMRYVNAWPEAPYGMDADLSADPAYVDDYVLGADSTLRDAGDPAILDADGSRSDVGYRGGPDAP